MQAHKRTTTAQTQPMALPQYAPVQMQNFSVMPAPGMMQAWPQPFQVAQTSYQMPMTMSMWPGVAPTMPMPFAYGMVNQVIIPPVLQPCLYYGNASRAAGASGSMQRAAPAYGEAPPDPAQSEKERLDRLEKERLQREKEEEERQARELLEKQRAELAKRMEKAGAKQGAMNVSLMWTNNSGKGCDLDLYVETPKGKISYSNKAMGNGKLDVDRQTSAGDMVENVFWTKPDVGKYHVYVRNCDRSSLKNSGGTMPFTVILKTDNSISLLDAEGKTTVPDFVGVKAFDHEFIGDMANISACYFEVKEGSIKT